MRILFFGSPEFAVPSLEVLRSSQHEILAAVTQPDRPSGRNLKLHPPPVKVRAQALGIPVFQPETTKTPQFLADMKAFEADILVVVAYGEILRRSLLESFPRGAVNLHASLLPAYRGAAPISWAILQGESKTGCTTMQINEAMDAGPLFLQEECEIHPADTTATITRKLATLGAPLLHKTLDLIEKNEIQAIPQDISLATYAPKLKKGDGIVNWTKPASWIARQIRAFDPWPGTIASLNGVRVKLWLAHSSDELSTEAPGTILRVSKPAIVVACGEGSTLLLVDVQPENRPRQTGVDFANGTRITPGMRFDPSLSLS